MDKLICEKEHDNAELQLIREGESIPFDVEEEISGGKGDDNDKK